MTLVATPPAQETSVQMYGVSSNGQFTLVRCGRQLLCAFCSRFIDAKRRCLMDCSTGAAYHLKCLPKPVRFDIEIASSSEFAGKRVACAHCEKAIGTTARAYAQLFYDVRRGIPAGRSVHTGCSLTHELKAVRWHVEQEDCFCDVCLHVIWARVGHQQTARRYILPPQRVEYYYHYECPWHPKIPSRRIKTIESLPKYDAHFRRLPGSMETSIRR